MNPRPAGIYIHIPFCIKKCRYCDFYSVTDTALMDRYVHALISEIKLSQTKPYLFDTVYFGGGTPSLLTPRMVAGILNALSRKFKFADSMEITLEANPATLNLLLLKAFKDAGINRIHLGVQSFSDPHLYFLGRAHTAADATDSISMIRTAGFTNMGIDLIYGLPEQDEAQWAADLKQALSYLPEHLSCYMLTYEPGTVLDKNRQAGLFEVLSDENAAVLFQITAETLTGAGYCHYEISNFAKTITGPDGISDLHTYRSRHNCKYWTFAPYLGFGPSAHSFEPSARYWNVSNLDDYFERIEGKKQPVEDREVLNRDQQMMEAISLGLRTCEGINFKTFEKDFGIPFVKKFAPVIRHLVEKGLLLDSSCDLRTTPGGMLILNRIIEMFVDLI